MGSSKRHKSEKNREVKKKRHRSRSRSYSPGRERSDKHRHHKKHKKKERKDYDSDVEIVSASAPPMISRTVCHSISPPSETITLSKDGTRHVSHREDRYHNHREEKHSAHTKEERVSKQRRSPTPPKSGQSQSSISIEETNRIRAKLGLKPLEVDTGPKEGSNIIKDDLGEFHHKPAANLVEKERTQKLKEKITVMKEKRKIEASLAAVKTIGESDSDDDALAWVKKSRKIEEEKKKAAERAKLLDQMDEEFGLDNLIKEEVKNDLQNAYTDRDLKGLKVEHNLEHFQEGSNVILTLKDKAVLEEDADVLVNVNMIDDERYKKNVLIKSKKPGYNAYDEDNFDENGIPKSHVLEKYDEEIEGEKRETFTIGTVDPKEIKERQAQIVKNKLANKRLESLALAEPKLANDYFNEQELVKFKKVRKKVRNKKKLQLKEVPDYLKDLGSRRPQRDEKNEKMTDALDVLDIEPPKEDLSKIKIEEEDKDFNLKIKPKALKLKEPISILKPEKIAMMIKEEVDTSVETNPSSNIVLNSVAEFCRTLGDIPTYGQAGNREENHQEFMDYQIEDIKHDPIEDDDIDGRGAWNTVRVTDDTLREPSAMEAAILDAEPSLDQGVGGALRLAMSKGYLQKEDSNRPSASRFAHLKAQNYSIEDKTYGDDDKFGRRDRFNGPTSDFKEKDGFRPNVKLEYIDDDGHVLNAKEAFRYLSHKFHGKGPGKNKVEKRMKKAEQEILMKRMSSTDTPLGTLTLLQAKQKETQSPFIVLSGNKQMQTASISKSKN